MIQLRGKRQSRKERAANLEANMTGFGSPCGACKFLRRKCVRGCVFAPYFCHEQGAAHFAAIHKVFGASNASKLLMHLPVSDRSEAAVTISYEAQARLQDPIYGCVAHIFALQQQVVNLQAQLASLKAQAAQRFTNGSISTSIAQEDRMNNRLLSEQAAGQGFFRPEQAKMKHPLVSDSPLSTDCISYHDNGLPDLSSWPSSQHSVPHSWMTDDAIFFGTDENSENAIGMQTVDRSSAYHNMGGP